MTEAADKAFAEMAKQWRITNMIAWRWLKYTHRSVNRDADKDIEEELGWEQR